MIMLLVVLAACGNLSEKSTSPQEESTTQSSKNSEVDSTTDSSSDDTQTEQVPTTDEENEEVADEGNSDSDVIDSKKEEYLQMLDEIEAELQNKPIGETQIEMEQFETEAYEIWDDALNKVYGALETQLPPDQMEKVREEQRKWIKLKYENARKEAAQYEGGSMESLTYIATQGKMTKERCYELVENYM